MKVKVLVADDDFMIRTLISEVLKTGNYDVILASDGKQAFDLFAEHRPAIMTLDWLMPEADGIEVLKKIRATYPDTPCHIIMLTTMEDPESSADALAAGANDFISKPFDTNDLLARVRVGVARVTKIGEQSRV